MLLCSPETAFINDASIARQWRALNYIGPPDYGRALEEFAAFTELLQSFGIAIGYMPANPRLDLDSIYVRDASVVTPAGMILGRMGKGMRAAEPEVAGVHYQSVGLAVVGAINGTGLLEGGDVVWFDQHTVAVGRGYRTNDEGIRQLEQLLGPEVQVIVVPLPHWKGEIDVFHLMSIISPLDSDLALAYSPLMPVPFRELLLERGIRLLEVPDDEFESLGCNVLAVAPRSCLMLAGNPGTRRVLQAAGVEVNEYVGREISTKGCGGPTCLTRPLWRG